MKILVICQYYYPEPFRVSDICEELVKRGHEVSVVAGLPNYPMGEIYEGYRNGEKRDEKINGVRVHRCFTIERKHGILHRILNYYSYAASSTAYVSKLEADYDVVLVNQLSPVMMANAGIKYKKMHKKRLVLYCLDLWPESLVIGGIGRGSTIYRLFHWISKKVYRQADCILVTSKSFEKYFRDEFGITDTVYLPQYAESIFTPAQCRKKPDEYIDLTFAGNLGTAQSVKTIIEAAALTNDIQNLRWHIIGDGSELEKLKRQAEGLDNITFYGRKTLGEMPGYYAMADAMLVTMQKDPAISLTVPGKVQTYMAAGKPIIGAIDGEARTVIEESGCGLCCSAEVAEELADLAKKFIATDRSLYAARSRECYERDYSKTAFFYGLENKLRNQ